MLTATSTNRSRTEIGVADIAGSNTAGGEELPPLTTTQPGVVALTHRVPRSGLVVWQGPSVGTTIVEELAPSLAVGIVQVHRHFALVATESRVVGWIDARALLPIRGTGDRWMQPATLSSVPGLVALIAGAVCLTLPFLKLPGNVDPSRVTLNVGDSFKVPVEWLWTWGDQGVTDGSGYSLGQLLAVCMGLTAVGFLLSLLRVRAGKLLARISAVLLLGVAITWLIRCIHFVNQVEDVYRRSFQESTANEIIRVIDWGRFELTGSGSIGVAIFALLALVAAAWPTPEAQRQR